MASLYRALPLFHGKKRLGMFFFPWLNNRIIEKPIKCRSDLELNILNTYDSIGKSLFFTGVYESETIDQLRLLLNRGDVIVDAGANIGAICLPIAKKTEVKVYAFEPSEFVYKALTDNIKSNKAENIVPIQKGLSDKNAMLDFYESKKYYGGSGPVPVDDSDCYKIEAITLDRFVEEEQIPKLKVLKVDVQGWEYYVFKGAEKLLDANRIDHIIFEFESWAEEGADLMAGAAQEFLMRKGFRLQTFSGEEITEPLTKGSAMLHAFI